VWILAEKLLVIRFPDESDPIGGYSKFEPIKEGLRSWWTSISEERIPSNEHTPYKIFGGILYCMDQGVVIVQAPKTTEELKKEKCLSILLKDKQTSEYLLVHRSILKECSSNITPPDGKWEKIVKTFELGKESHLVYVKRLQEKWNSELSPHSTSTGQGSEIDLIKFP